MPLFSRSGRFRQSFGQAWTTLDPNWCPVKPLAGPAELQNGSKSHSKGQALTNLSTQSSAVDLHAQLNLRICYTWPSSWLCFLRFCANRMAWLWSGKETVKPHWSNGNPELDWPAWHWNRICKDAFDWQTKGSAGDRRGLNLAWRPDVNGLAMQSQMAKRPRHGRQSFNCLRF